MDLGPSDVVSTSYTDSLLSDFRDEMSSTTDIPMCTARAAQSTEAVAETYLSNMRAEMAKARLEGCFRPKQTWADASSITAMDEVGFGKTPGARKTIGEKQRAAKKRVSIEEGRLMPMPRASATREQDRKVMLTPKSRTLSWPHLCTAAHPQNTHTSRACA